MDEKARRQTTKGIWLNKAKDSDILVMDVEGTDGRERGENQDFERKSALFSISLAEVIIVNMWENMVGLYNGANMGLLKTVFEVNLQLFGSRDSPKTCLCFVIRDFTGMTPLETLANTVKEDLEKIWADLRKPQGLEESKIGDFFDFSFNALPHKIYAFQQFLQDVGSLKLKFTTETMIFKDMYSRKIPIDGVPHFAKEIWDKIVSNKDLHLPTQQQLLAQFRCSEIQRETLDFLQQQVEPIEKRVLNNQFIVSLKQQLQLLSEQALERFDEHASRYSSDVYSKVRAELLTAIDSTLDFIKSKQASLIIKQLIERFKQSKVDGKNPQKVFTLLKSLESDINKEFDSKISETLDSSDQLRADFQVELNEIFISKKQEILSEYLRSLESEIADAIQDFSVEFGTVGFWPSVLEKFNSLLVKYKDQVTLLAQEFCLQDTSNLENSVSSHSLNTFVKLITRECSESAILAKMKNKFELKFRFDPNGIPRVWTADDPMEKLFEQARDDGYSLLDSFERVNLKEISQDLAVNNPVTKYVASQVKQKYLNEIQVYYLEAKRSLVQQDTKIPVWFIVLTIVLGWNEMMAVLRNPLFFVFLLLVAGAAWMSMQLGIPLNVYTNAFNEMLKSVYSQMSPN